MKFSITCTNAIFSLMMSTIQLWGGVDAKDVGIINSEASKVQKPKLSSMSSRITQEVCSPTNRFTKLGSDITGMVELDGFGEFIALSADGSIVMSSSIWHDGPAGTNSGYAQVLKYNEATGDWKQLGQLIEGVANNDMAGYAVSMSADGYTIAVSSPLHDLPYYRGGNVRIFTYDFGTETWVLKGGEIGAESAYDDSGKAMELSSDGSIVAIGSPRHGGVSVNRGAVRVFEFDDANKEWVQLGQDLDGTTSNSQYGKELSLSADGSVLAVSSNNGQKGRVSIFTYDVPSLSWVPVGEEFVGEETTTGLGWSTDLSSDGMVLAIGAIWYSGSKGYVQVYKNDNGAWISLGQRLVGERANDIFGVSVSLSADASTLAVGATGYDEGGVISSTGDVKVYSFDTTLGIWSEIGDSISGHEAWESFGKGLSISEDGSRLAIGGRGTDKGRMAIFEICEIQTPPTAPPTASPTVEPSTTPSTQPSCVTVEKSCKETEDSRFYFNIALHLQEGNAKKLHKVGIEKRGCKWLAKKLSKRPEKKELFCWKTLIMGGAWDRCDITCGYCIE